MSTKKAANETANETRGKSTQKSVILRDFFSLGNTQEEKDEPSPLVGDYIVSIQDGKTLQDYLKGFDFKSEEKIKEAVKILIYAVATDSYLSIKSNRETNPFNMIAYSLAGYTKQPGDLGKNIGKIASEVWNEFFLPKRREERLRKMFSKPIDRNSFDAAFLRIMKIYGFNYLIMYRLQYFVIQCKLRSKFPLSQQRVLYFHGEGLIGKSKVGMILAAILNGDLNLSEEYRLKSLKNEINFACGNALGYPYIAGLNCVTADEVFIKGRNNNGLYQDFKSIVTSEGGKCRNPYGQWREWHGRANYIFTSNYPLQDFIPDFRDRRFLEVPFMNTPEQIEDAELILLWYDFVVNAEPRKFGADYPESLEAFIKSVGNKSNVDGDYTQIVDAIKAAIVSPDFLMQLETRHSNEVSIQAVMTIVHNIEPSFKNDREIARSFYKTAIIELFGESEQGKYRWSKALMVKALNDMLKDS